MEALWSVKELSEFLKVRPRTLYQKRYLGTLPMAAIVKCGSLLRFRPEIIRDWISGKPVAMGRRDPVRPRKATRTKAKDGGSDACSSSAVR